VCTLSSRYGIEPKLIDANIDGVCVFFHSGPLSLSTSGFVVEGVF
jgi:hypothetical protein